MGDEVKAGAIVRIRSGGPHMTVSGVSGDEAEVVYYEDGRYQTGRLPACVLEVIDPAAEENCWSAEEG